MQKMYGSGGLKVRSPAHMASRTELGADFGIRRQQLDPRWNPAPRTGSRPLVCTRDGSRRKNAIYIENKHIAFKKYQNR